MTTDTPTPTFVAHPADWRAAGPHGGEYTLGLDIARLIWTLTLHGANGHTVKTVGQYGTAEEAKHRARLDVAGWDTLSRWRDAMAG